MRKRVRWALAVAVAGVVVLAISGPAVEAGHGGTPKHKIVYHFNGADDGNHVKKARAVLGNILNHVNGVGGWDNIEALVLVTHGDGITPFIEAGMDPEVRKRFEMLTTGGMKLGV
jgi:intracellular sulfur oxidation DsrE/DsrF family protein